MFQRPRRPNHLLAIVGEAAFARGGSRGPLTPLLSLARCLCPFSFSFARSGFGEFTAPIVVIEILAQLLTFEANKFVFCALGCSR